MTASKTDKKDTVGGTRGRKMLFDLQKTHFLRLPPRKRTSIQAS